MKFKAHDRPDNFKENFYVSLCLNTCLLAKKYQADNERGSQLSRIVVHPRRESEKNRESGPESEKNRESGPESDTNRESAPKSEKNRESGPES
jgi:hypothetical protein